MPNMRIAITPGEPAGIGPDLIIQLAQTDFYAQQENELVIISDPELLQNRALTLKLPLQIRLFDALKPAIPSKKSEVCVLPVKLTAPCIPGALNKDNAHHVLSTLETAIDGCMKNSFHALVTAPVQKSIINDAGIFFSGHTEFLAKKTNTKKVVMMLTTKGLKVALVTTHLPLKDVPQHITKQEVESTIRIINNDLKNVFDIDTPRIMVLGLNPHAGENGHLGQEEINHIIPAIEQLRDERIYVSDPLPADTAFNEKYLMDYDVVLAMYHDQGLPVLKYKGFGSAVNITLGLPIIRTSVDHGTALDLAGSGQANIGSLQKALEAAITMANNKYSEVA